MISREIEVKADGRDTRMAVPVPVSTRWLDDFLRLRCVRDILPFFRCDHPAKEISESMAAFEAAVKRLPQGALADPDTVCLVPGDGVIPRTGAMVAHRTRWKVVCVDPNTRPENQWPRPVERLQVRRRKVEGMQPIRCKVGIILSVHSHAPLKVAWQKLEASERKVAVALPCCTKQKVVGLEPVQCYRDLGVLSPKNKIWVWDSRTDPIEGSQT
jgi:hypothetical protein